MKPAQYPDLKVLIQKLDKRNKERQAARVILAGSAVLGLLVLVSPLLPKPTQQVAVTEPEVVVPAPVDAYGAVRLEGRAAIVYDLTTKEVLFQKNAKAQLPLASLTKLLTAYVGATTLGRDATVAITESAAAVEGDSGLMVGEEFTLANAAKLALVASSNDAAAAITEAAEAKAATSKKTLMASAISAIGLPQTYAVNGTGLDVSTTLSGGYGSAYDVAQLAGALIAVAPEIAQATAQSSVTVSSRAGVAHTLKNTNQSAVRIPNLLLSKTGYTDLAGGNLAVVYDAGIGHPVAIVVLGSSIDGRFSDVSTLLSLTRNHFAGIAYGTPSP